MGRTKPFSNKLFFLIVNSIENKNREEVAKIYDLVYNFATRNKWQIRENFENIEFESLYSFVKKGKEVIERSNKNDFLDWLSDNIRELALEQLLFFFTMWEYAKMINSGENTSYRRLVY